MHLSLNILVLAFSTLTTALSISPNQQGCVIETPGDPGGLNMRIFIQQPDTSIVEVLPRDPNSPSAGYDSIQALAPGRARSNTPLACTAFYDSNGFISQVNIFYVNNNYGGTEIAELVWQSGGFRDGALAGYGYCMPTSMTPYQLFYASTNGRSASNSMIRLGFACDGIGKQSGAVTVCQVWRGDSLPGGWHLGYFP